MVKKKKKKNNNVKIVAQLALPELITGFAFYDKDLCLLLLSIRVVVAPLANSWHVVLVVTFSSGPLWCRLRPPFHTAGGNYTSGSMACLRSPVCVCVRNAKCLHV